MPNLIPKIKDTPDDKAGVEMYKKKIMAGEHRPILVDEDNNHIIDGNHTLTAYKELGIEPPILYSGKRAVFLKAVCDELIHNHNKPRTNPGLDGVYKMIREGKAKRL